MQTDELITGYPVPWGSKGATKTKYAITDAGIGYLRAWQEKPVTYRPERNEMRLRAAYFEFADDADAQRSLQEHLAHHRQVVVDVEHQMQELREGTTEIHQRRLASYPRAEHPRITGFKIFAYEGILKQAEAEISWAQDGLAMLGVDEPSEALDAG